MKLLLPIAVCMLWSVNALPAQKAAGEKDTPIQKDRKALEGTWKFILYKEAGVNAPDAKIEKSGIHIIGDGTMHGQEEGKTLSEATTVLDPTKTPKTIDLTYTKGGRKGKTVWGIYEVVGDTLRICYALPGESRPTEFSSKEGSAHVLMALKKQPK